MKFVLHLSRPRMNTLHLCLQRVSLLGLFLCHVLDYHFAVLQARVSVLLVVTYQPDLFCICTVPPTLRGHILPVVTSSYNFRTQ